MVDDGVEDNSLVTDEDTEIGYEGPAALSRLAEDVLSEPDIGTVVIDEGLQDVISAGDSSTENTTVNEAYAELANQLTAWGVTVVFTTLTPCDGYSASDNGDDNSCPAGTVDDNRVAINKDYLSGYSTLTGSCSLLFGACEDVDDFDAAVSDGDSPEQLRSAYSAGDDVNLTAAGYTALATVLYDDDQFAADDPPSP